MIPIMGIKKQGLGDVLFSKVQQRILSLFFGHPNRIFYTNEIIRLSHSGTGAVLRELEKLSSVGLVVVKQVGNQKQYQVNQEASIFVELQGIVRKTFGLVDVLKEALEPISSQLQSAFIYGSIAKHEDKVSSDIDLMLIGDDLSYAELYPLLEAAQIKLGRQVNPTFYDSKEWVKKREGGNNFIAQLLKQPKIFIKGTKDDLI